MGKNKLKKDINERREDLLRPSRYLGYDHDELGMYLLSRGAYKIAESQLRRAVWLNPYEYRFVCHLAWCLYKQGRFHEAQKLIGQVDAEDVDANQETQIIIQCIKQKVF